MTKWIFHFTDINEAQETLRHLRNGATASPAILREAQLYLKLGKEYPFRKKKVKP